MNSMFNLPARVAILASLTPSVLVGADNARRPARADFGEALRACVTLIELGTEEWSDAEIVLAVLGKPDEVRTRPDTRFPKGQIWRSPRYYEIQTVWCYGVVQPGGLPTLGQVCFSKDMELRLVVGDRDARPEIGTLQEKRLRELLALINTAPRCEGSTYNPLPVIRIANALQPLGKEKALAVIDEYLRVTPVWYDWPREGLFLVLRVLFSAPLPRLGTSVPARPVRLSDFPRFPIVVEDDVPLLLHRGLSGNNYLRVETAIEDYRNSAVCMRHHPLRPGASPERLPDRIVKAENFRWFLKSSPYDSSRIKASQRLLLQFVRGQVLRLLQSDSKHAVLPDSEKLDWPSAVAKLNKLNFKWDERSQSYRVADDAQAGTD